MARRVLAVIPARLGSSRFPGKLMHPHRGKPLLYHLWRHLTRSKQIDRLIVATDSVEIRRTMEAFGADVLPTSKRHRTGTDRVAEVASRVSGDIVINIQGDCFGLKATVLDRLIIGLKTERKGFCTTLVRPIDSDDELFDPGVVKVVTDRQRKALWFSRYALPYLQKPGTGDRWSQFKFRAHIGVYGFHRKALEQYASWPRGPLEKAESLEQLRILENGGEIQVLTTRSRVVSVDTPADMKKIARLYT